MNLTLASLFQTADMAQCLCKSLGAHSGRLATVSKGLAASINSQSKVWDVRARFSEGFYVYYKAKKKVGLGVCRVRKIRGARKGPGMALVLFPVGKLAWRAVEVARNGDEYMKGLRKKVEAVSAGDTWDAYMKRVRHKKAALNPK